jgi:transcriptional regulator with XRE-family HTH domain
MSTGQAVAQARKDKGYTQDQLSMDLYCSREAVSKYETGDRTIPKDLRPKISQTLDDPFLYIEMAVEATGKVSTPVLNGEYIDRHPASMKDLVQREANEALEHLDKACMIKPIHLRTDQEKQEMKQVVMELLDAIVSMKNLVAVICKEYKFSMKEIFETWRVTLKARKWKK